MAEQEELRLEAAAKKVKEPLPKDGANDSKETSTKAHNNSATSEIARVKKEEMLQV